MKKKKLGEICVFNYGDSLPEHQRMQGEIGVYGSNGLVGKHNKPLTDGQTIVIGRKGSIGEVHFSNVGCWPIDTTYFIDKRSTECDVEWLRFLLTHLQLSTLNKASAVPGLNREDVYALEVIVPDTKKEQETIASKVKSHLAQLSEAKQAAQKQKEEVRSLCDSIIFNSLNCSGGSKSFLGNVLDEVKQGIGENWKKYPVHGATRAGLAPARERPGKHPERYKPVFPGTVFYNPMRILIGSIAFVDNDDQPGITSPDYVALTGKPGVVDSRWFYYWLKSPLGEQCINSLARGAVRERLLFNRLAEGEVELPNFTTQEKASKALAEIKPMRAAIEKQFQELELMPKKLLAQFFES
jgi:type I restriction enzyme S subunit